MSRIAKPQSRPIFTSLRPEGDNGYGKMAAEMVELASNN